MKEVYIYQHLGLGDHIICNGLVREIANQNRDVIFYLFSKAPYVKSNHWMYRDVENIKILGAYSEYPDHAVLEFIQNKNLGMNLLRTGYNINEISNMVPDGEPQLLKIGHEFFNNGVQFDNSFYNQFNMDFCKRWSSFYIKRDFEKETSLFESFNMERGYTVIHEDSYRRMVVRDVNRDNCLVIDKNITENIFDYLTILENASEIHCIESCFLFLIDSFNFKSKLFSHRYARQYPPNLAPTLKNKWTILN